MLKDTKYFSVREMTYSDTALKKGIENTPESPTIVGNIMKTAGYLDQIREFLGFPLSVNSWYRCPELNTAVKGSKSSDHLKGLAVDLTSRKQTAYALCLSIAEACEKLKIPFDQIIYEGTWVHIGFGTRQRGQKLTYRGGVYHQGFKK